jgi:D-alanyl-D-alanine carboxypeptidase (penicillin-binding protein 5/6)
VYVRRRLLVGIVGVGMLGTGLLAASMVSDHDSDSTATGTSVTTFATMTRAAPVSTGNTAVAVAPVTTVAAPVPSSTGAVLLPPPTPAATGAPPASPPTTVVGPATTGAAPAPPASPTSTATGDLVTDPSAPIVAAAAYGAFDWTSGQWLTATNADVQRPVGSIMKLLTAHVVMRAGDPSKVVTVPSLRLDPQESAIGLYVGEELPRDVLLRALLIVSANDAAEALAVDVGGTRERFVEMMNDAASDLGLRGTVAANASGLDAAGAVSTARDAVTLAAELMKDETFRATVARPSARLHEQTFPATNELLATYPGADGVKTGSTSQAGYGVVASATRDERTVVVVVLGAPTDDARFAHAAALLDWAFAQQP